MKKVVLLISSILLLLSVLPVSVGWAVGIQFKDLTKTHWAKKAIYEMAAKGAVSGFPDGTFRPDTPITADQFITMMIMAHTEIYPDGKRDWKLDWWDAQSQYSQSILINLGFDFKPSKKGYWAQSFINQAVGMGFLKLNDGMFDGDYKSLLTREKSAFLLETWLNTYEPRESNGYLMLAKSGVKDIYAASEGGQFSIMVALIKGVMRGYPDGTFRPNRLVTRAEAVKMIQSLSDKSYRNPYQPDLTGAFHTSLNWIDGSPRVVVFQRQEFVDATEVLEKAGSQTKGVSFGNKMGQAFFANQSDLDIFLNPNTEIFDYTMDKNTGEMGILIGEGDNSYEMSVHFNKTFQSTHKEAYEAFSNLLFGAETDNFTEKLIAIANKYEQTFPMKIKREEYVIHGRSVSLSPLLGTKRIAIYISEKR
ncbi:MAG TPA: S-layer homology domain-containing protein [Bacilli bacterium]